MCCQQRAAVGLPGISSAGEKRGERTWVEQRRQSPAHPSCLSGFPERPDPDLSVGLFPYNWKYFVSKVIWSLL